MTSNPSVKIDSKDMALDDVLDRLGWTWTPSFDAARIGNRIIDADGLDYGVMHSCDAWSMLRDQGKII